MRPAAHITTPKYRRNRAIQANPGWLAGAAPHRRNILFHAPSQSVALAYDGRTGSRLWPFAKLEDWCRNEDHESRVSQMPFQPIGPRDGAARLRPRGLARAG